jgi:hypothetical protein
MPSKSNRQGHALVRRKGISGILGYGSVNPASPPAMVASETNALMSTESVRVCKGLTHPSRPRLFGGFGQQHTSTSLQDTARFAATIACANAAFRRTGKGAVKLRMRQNHMKLVLVKGSLGRSNVVS